MDKIALTVENLSKVYIKNNSHNSPLRELNSLLY